MVKLCDLLCTCRIQVKIIKETAENKSELWEQKRRIGFYVHAAMNGNKNPHIQKYDSIDRNLSLALNTFVVYISFKHTESTNEMIIVTTITFN